MNPCTRCNGSGTEPRHRKDRDMTELDLNARAAAFAKEHGSFALHFDATRNYVRPDDCPWTLILDADEESGWGGFTAEDALDFAARELAAAEGAAR